MTAFGITVDDVQQVLDAHGIEGDADAIFDLLDQDSIESEALDAEVQDDEETLQQQTVCAFQEIENQLKELNILDEGAVTKFPLE